MANLWGDCAERIYFFIFLFCILNSQHLQVGEASKSSVCDKAHTVVPNVELVQQAEAHEAGFLQSGQVVGGEVAARWTTETA